MSDGLTVPFALAAGLSGAVDSTRVVITAGLAEIAAGSIAMGLGGYLAARTDAEHYASERAREIRETVEIPEEEKREVAEVFQKYGLSETLAENAANAISKNRKRWIDFMMRFELGLEEPDPRRARTSALTIALSYMAGGLVPLAPYFLFRRMADGARGLDRGDAGGAPRLRLRQGPLHREEAAAQRLADRGRRRPRGRGRVRDREAHRVEGKCTRSSPRV